MFAPALQDDQRRRQAGGYDEVKEISAAPEAQIEGDKSTPETTIQSDNAIRVEGTTQPSASQ